MTIVFLDFETTDLDVDRTLLLEVGCVAVTAELNPLTTYHRLIWSDPETTVQRMGDYVRNMHETSGLTRDRELADMRPGGLADIVDLIAELTTWLDDLVNGPDDDLVLAGSGVAEFDRPIMRRLMPSVERRFHYRTLDVGLLRRMLPLIDLGDIADEMHAAGERNDAPHRALQDATSSYHQLLAARDLGIEIRRRWADTL